MLRRVSWIGSAKKDFSAFPAEVIKEVGFALYLAQTGAKHDHVKPLKGFGGAGVLEVVEDHEGDTYRAVYTVQLRHAIYVLHAFQKKSKRGSKTPQADLDLIRRLLKDAEFYDKDEGNA
jgi:phage-related protein